MKSIVCIAAFSLLSFHAFAVDHDHREHGAHSHGAADLGIAFEGASGKIEFKTPADGIVGFEHKAVKSADKKKFEAALKNFESKFSEMISFDASLKCVFTKEKLEAAYDSDSHSDIVGQFKVVCAKSPAGSTITFQFQKFYPKLKDVDAQIIADNLQKSVEIKTKGQKLELK